MFRQVSREDQMVDAQTNKRWDDEDLQSSQTNKDATEGAAMFEDYQDAQPDLNRGAQVCNSQ